MPTHKLTPEIINAAILGFEAQKTRIDDQIAELRAMLSGGPAESAATPDTSTLKGRKFSPAARRRMKEAQQRRWAKIRGESEPVSPPVTQGPSKPKRKLSAAGRAAIVAALKKRWRERKAAPAAAKKGTAQKASVKMAKKASAKKAAKAPETAGTATA